MSLYLKHRPDEFEKMLGNEDQLKALNSALSKTSRPHTYLFVGPPGCGKTTAARIAARTLGAGEMSVVEINSANNRGIETARQIIDQMRYNPTDGEALVFIIDELHVTTKDWQNAMLKPLEDTPDHVYFFLCTTDPQKLLPALKTRCSEFKFGAMTKDNVALLLRQVNRAEGFGLSKEVLLSIADHCDGSARKALVLLEKVAGLGDDAAVQERLIEAGMPDAEDVQVIELCRALLKEKAGWGPIAEILKGMDLTDPEKVRYAVLGYMGSVLLSGKQNLRAALALDYFAEPFYNSGKNGVILACYQTVFAG